MTINRRYTKSEVRHRRGLLGSMIKDYSDLMMAKALKLIKPTVMATKCR